MAKSRDELLSQSGRRYTDCEGFRIQSLNDLEWSEWESRRVNYEKGKVDVREVKASRRRLLVKVLVDEEGKRLFQDSEADKLIDVDARLIGSLFDAAMSHCGYEDNDEEVEAERKN